MAIIVFDVDGTLMTYNDKPREDIIATLKLLHKLGNRILVHSGGGKDYARHWVEKLYLQDYVTSVHAKGDAGEVDIAFDDEFVEFGSVNIKV